MNITTAANQYATRPADERYTSVSALIEASQQQKARSKTVSYNAKDVRAIETDAGDLALQTPKGIATFSHWSHGQLCRSIGAPSGYIRTLPPELAARNINHGLQHTPPSTDLVMLAEAPKAAGQYPTIRACTSEQYSRIWDADLFEYLQAVTRHDARWTTPPTWSGEPAGVYKGDRDSFVILVNGGSIVEDPSLRNSLYRTPTTAGAMNDASDPGGMFRGLMIRNSEVGAASLTLQQILFRFICGNHILWGASIAETFSRRHVGSGDAAMRDTVRKIARIAQDWTESSAQRDQAIIAGLVEKEIAHTKAAVLDELKAIGFTKAQAEAAYTACEQHEPASPRSWWGVAQGATRASQTSGYQDERLTMDQLAAKLLAKGRKLVAA